MEPGCHLRAGLRPQAYVATPPRPEPAAIESPNQPKCSFQVVASRRCDQQTENLTAESKRNSEEKPYCFFRSPHLVAFRSGYRWSDHLNQLLVAISSISGCIPQVALW